MLFFKRHRHGLSIRANRPILAILAILQRASKQQGKRGEGGGAPGPSQLKLNQAQTGGGGRYVFLSAIAMGFLFGLSGLFYLFWLFCSGQAG